MEPAISGAILGEIKVIRVMNSRYVLPRRRWAVAGMLFLATAINYIDRQTLSILEPLLKTQFRMSSTDYSHIINAYLASCAIMSALGGRVMDWLGTRLLGMSVHVAWWSVPECLHALSKTVPQLSMYRFLLVRPLYPRPAILVEALTTTEVVVTYDRASSRYVIHFVECRPCLVMSGTVSSFKPSVMEDLPLYRAGYCFSNTLAR